MRRRDLLSGAASSFVWLVPARAHQSNKLKVIGNLATEPSASTAFFDRLRELGWVEGRTVVIERRYSEGRPERVAEAAAELVQKKVDVVYTFGSAVPKLAELTTTIPIVFVAIDPVGAGIVAGLSHPGGNITGLSLQSTDLVGKRLELLREIVPGFRRLQIMFEPDNREVSLEKAAVELAARKLGLDVLPRGIRRAEDIGPVFDTAHPSGDALYLIEGPVVFVNRAQIAALALTARLPTIFNIAAATKVGGLMSYGPSLPALQRRAADLVDKILRGAHPGEIPVEQPTKFDLVINLKTAKALGLTVPEEMLALADEVVE
jgi:putative tryptophan/tyrosine transport system substrate-binding protein